jgi:hypothetical protein
MKTVEEAFLHDHSMEAEAMVAEAFYRHLREEQMSMTKQATLAAIVGAKKALEPDTILPKRLSDPEGWKRDKKRRKQSRKSRRRNRR